MRPLLITLMIASSSLFAGTIFQITPTYPDGTLQAVQDTLNLMFDELETEINGSLPDAEASTYLDGVGNATVMAAKGQGADYTSNMSLFSAGFNLGLGLSTTGEGGIADLTSGASTLAGFGASSAVTLGLSLRPFGLPKIGFIDLAKLKVYLNYLSLTLPSSIEGVTGSISSFGLHAQYKLMDGSGIPKLAYWNGVEITSGFNTTNFDFSITQSFSSSSNTTVSGQPVTATFTSDVTLGASVSTFSIPIEISTSAQVLYFLSPFVGLGVDFNFGSVESDVSGDGPILLTGAGVPAGTSAQASLSLGDDGSPSFTNARLFYGFQMNFSLLKLFAQINSGLGNDATSVNLGARITW